ncbi:Conserved_hypothetical protein [Hexamita inflata]|uniref:Uncharacterized protein n=1 Tax=Hexamita inflata TaxID=28002 RepID=A0AA86TMF1_9EUKA|nr:Conserved hypothetical protein [Hexamita inflata]
MICSQPAYITTFDIQEITTQISAQNFTSGSVFGSQINISNTFIDIQDNTYAVTVSPLFQDQNQFYNIKIQFGSQNIQTGELLSASSSIIINNLRLISKLQSSIQMNSGYMISILQRHCNSASIKDMYLNLTITASSSGLGLFNQLYGQIQLINYQISGVYETQGWISFGAIVANTSQIIVKFLNFVPQSFTVGNMSAALFCVINSSNIEISKTVIKLGDQNTSLQITSITTTATKYLQFGGLISMSNSSRIVIAEISYYSNLSCQTQYINNSGWLLGSSISSSSQILLQSICLSITLLSDANMSQFGVIGICNGNISLISLNIQKTCNFAIIINYGVFGQVNNSQLLKVSNINIQIYISIKYGNNASVLVGVLDSQNCSISNLLFYNSSSNNTGISGLISFSLKDIYIYSCSVDNVNLQQSGDIGLFISKALGYICITSSQVSDSFIYQGGYAGGFLAFVDSDINISRSISNNIVIESKYNLGGILGKIANLIHNAYLADTNSSGCQITSQTGYTIGGIIGTQESVCVVLNSQSVGNILITNNSGSGVGGIVGFSTINTTIITGQVINLFVCSVNFGNGGFIGYSCVTIIINSKIYNISINSTNQTGGFVGNQTSNSTIIKCSLENVSLNSNKQVGGIIGSSLSYANISNVILNNCSIKSQNYIAGGFIATSNFSNIQQCQLINMIIVSYQQCGGIIGITQDLTAYNIIDNVIIQNINIQSLTGSVGGFIGISISTTQIFMSEIYNVLITSANDSTGLGGFVGFSQHIISINDCIGQNITILSNSQGIGGFIGNSNVTTLINCTIYNSKFKSDIYVGGLIGKIQQNLTNIDQQLQILFDMVQVKNIDISTNNYSGSFIGYYNSNYNLIIKNSNIHTVNIQSSISTKLVIGNIQNNVTYTVQNSKSEGNNYINNIKLNTCSVISVLTNISGC